MILNRSLAIVVVIVAASLCGAAIAQNYAALDDETIFVAVENALQRARSLALANITVRSQDGLVTLSGVANTMENVATAGMVAARVRGVTGVRNEIRVAHRAWRG
jgi:osmotically-inducible protein OsmY